MKNTTVKRVFVLALSIAVLIVFSAMIPGTAVSAKEKKLPLPTKVTCYDKDGKVSKTLTYTYDKYGVVTKIVEKGNVLGTHTYKFKVTYKKGKPVSSSLISEGDVMGCTLNSKGDMTKRTWEYYDYNFTYDKKGRIKKVLKVDTEDEIETPQVYTYNKNGTKLTVKVVKPGVKTYTLGTYTYNKNGLMTSSKDRKYSDDKFKTVKYTYKMKNGQVKEQTVKNSDGVCRIVYKYGKVKVSKSCYNDFINNANNSMRHLADA